MNSEWGNFQHSTSRIYSLTAENRVLCSYYIVFTPCVNSFGVIETMGDHGKPWPEEAHL